MPFDLLPLGVHADTGARLPSIDEETLETFSTEPLETAVPSEQIEAKSSKHLGPDDDVEDANDLSQTGWAILYGPNVSDSVKKALQPLIEHRRKQVGNDALVKEFDGPEGFQPGDTAAAWLAREPRKIPLTDVDPKRGVPYYVLLIGGPEEISFEFQYGLDLFWAVGRLAFETPSEYARYAESVIAYEQAPSIQTTRHMALFAPRNGADRAMELFTENVAHPMQTPTEAKPAFGVKEEFRLHPSLGPAATVETLDKILRGAMPQGPPAILFTGSHGMVFESGDERQNAQQGAIVCDEWKGVDPPKRSSYLAGGNIAGDAKVHGMIHFLFDCYGAGWPRNDNFARTAKRPPKIAEGPAIARLPQALLAHRNGGALAVLGHVDRAWSTSYHSARLGPQIDGFRTVVSRLMKGHRIGHATDRLNARWSTLSVELAEQLQRKDNDLPVDAEELRAMWIARDDARNYIVLGDPAVCLREDLMPPLPA
jgi:hypothetical protein